MKSSNYPKIRTNRIRINRVPLVNRSHHMSVSCALPRYREDHSTKRSGWTNHRILRRSTHQQPTNQKAGPEEDGIRATRGRLLPKPDPEADAKGKT